MNKILFSLLTALVFFAACTKKAAVQDVKEVQTNGIAAVGPYLTADAKGNPVLCWSEQDGKDSLYRLKYAVYNESTNQFGEAVVVPGSAGCSTSAESMGKVAFKADGTVMAIFAKRFPQEKNPYAGAIYYSLSADEGKTWSAEKFIHSDTAHAYGRSFFDVTPLKDGELAAVWLDGRYGKTIKGSALFFSRTQKGKGFETDTCLDKGTCECCRTDLLTDDQGNIHLAYRSIMFPSALSGKQVRDMAYKVSSDQGKTFSTPKTISKDNWEIEGCPHSGPSLAEANGKIQAVWFTAGGSPGLYYTSAPGLGGDFKSRNLITAEGRHPQMVSMPNGKSLMVCEEAAPQQPMKMDHSKHGGMMMSHGPAATAKIILRTLKDGVPENKLDLTDGQHADNHAVLRPLKNSVLVAWVREEGKHSKICYTNLKVN